MSAHEGLRVVVTGAASGIGRAAADALHAAGARVIGLDVRPSFTSPRRGEVDAASAAAGEGALRYPDESRPPHPALRADLSPAQFGCSRIERLGMAKSETSDFAGRGKEGIARVICDLAIESQVVAAMAEAAQTLGGLDAVVNSAGLDLESPLSAFDLAAFDRMIAVNLRGTILVSREALRLFGPDGGKIVNVASELGYLGRSGASGYCATKGAILALTRSWARELAPTVLVNAVAPGPIDTPLLSFSTMTPAQQALETANPLGRIGRADEVAEAILFLTSRRTTFMTGQCVSVDGGAAMH